MKPSINDLAQIHNETWKILDLSAHDRHGNPQLALCVRGGVQQQFNVAEITKLVPRGTVKKWRR